MCHHRPRFFPPEAGARPRHRHRLCERECCAIHHRQYHEPSAVYTTTYIHSLHPLLLPRLFFRLPSAHARKPLLHPGPTLFLCIYTLTQPLLPLRADSAYFHRASIAVRLSRRNSTSHSPSTCCNPNLHPSTKQRERARARVHMAWPAHLSSIPSSSPSKHLASLTFTHANDPLIICAAHRTLLQQQSIH